MFRSIYGYGNFGGLGLGRGYLGAGIGYPYFGGPAYLGLGYGCYSGLGCYGGYGGYGGGYGYPTYG
jgi:hypothetical protein